MSVAIEHGHEHGVRRPGDSGSDTPQTINGPSFPLHCHQDVGLGVGQAADSPEHRSIRRASHHRRSRSLHSAQELRDLMPALAPLLPGHRSDSASPRLQHSPTAIVDDCVAVPALPTRPPLRPTISFGGETRYSYHSTLDFPSLARKPVAMVAKENKIQQEESAGVANLCLIDLSDLLVKDLALSSLDVLGMIIGWVLVAAIGQIT